MSTKRWIEEDSGATEFERELLATGLGADPPAGAERAVWQSLVVVVAPPPLAPVPGSVASAAAATAGAKALTSASTLVTLGKGFALGVGVSLAAAGIGRLDRVRSPAARASASATIDPPFRAAPAASPNPQPELPRTSTPHETTLSEPLAAPETRADSDEPSDATRGAPQPLGVSRSLAMTSRLASPSATNSPPSVPFAAGTSSVAAFPLSDAAPSTQKKPASKQSELEEEATMLSRARAELRDGKLSEAFATLEAAREKFSLPELRQEREALLIELLYRSGQRATAVERAKEFLRRYPKSPHTVQVRSIANAELR